MPPFYILAHQKHSDVPVMINPEQVAEWALVYDNEDLIKEDYQLELHLGTFDAESATVIDLGGVLLAAQGLSEGKNKDFVVTYKWLNTLLTKIREAVTYLLIGRAETPAIVDIQDMVTVGFRS